MAGRRARADTEALEWLQREASAVPAAVPGEHRSAIKRLARRGQAVARLVGEPTNHEVRATGIRSWWGYTGRVRARLYACTPEAGGLDEPPTLGSGA